MDNIVIERSRVLLWMAAACFVVAATAIVSALTRPDGPENGILVGVFALLMLILVENGWVTVSIDSAGFVVRSRVFGIPLKSIAWKDVESARIERLQAAAWGGWGYRWAPGRSAIVLRSGPGVVVITNSGKEFGLTTALPDRIVDSAEAAGVTIAR